MKPSHLPTQFRPAFLRSATVFPALCTVLCAGSASAATTLFADNFNRANNNGLNASTTGKSGTLGALNWVEVSPASGTPGDVDIASNQMALVAGNATNNSGVAYVDHNFTFVGSTAITVALDYVSAPNAGSIRQLGFGIGNAKATLDALTSSGPFGDIRISFDLATSLDSTTGIQILEGATQVGYLNRTIASGDTLSATFTFSDMNAGSTINYEVFHEGVSIFTGDHTWSGTDQNYIGLFNTHRNVTGDAILVDNFVVSIPEPQAALLGGIGLLALIRRRR